MFRASIPLGAPVEVDAAAQELRRRTRLPKAEDTGRSAFAGVRRRHVHPPRGHRHCRPAADAGGNRSVPGRHESRQAGELGSTRCWPARTTPTFSPTSGTPSCATSGARRPMPAAHASSTTGFATACTPTCRTISSCGQLLTATGEIGRNPPVAWYREVNEINEQVRRHGAIVPGLAHSMRPLPPPSVREVEPAGLLRLRRVLLPHRAQARRAGERRAHRLQPWDSPRPRIPRPARPLRPPAWAQSRRRSRPKTIRARRWSIG